MFKPLNDRDNKGMPRFEYGVWLGLCARSDEVYIGLPSGEVVKARTVRRLEPQDMWSKEAIKGIRGRPWAPVDCEKMEDAFATLPSDKTIPCEIPKMSDEGQERQGRVNRIKIGKEDVRRHGYTPNCQGC